jgi:integrase
MAVIEKRITADNKTTYRVKVRLKGYPTQSATFDRVTDAKKWAQDTESAIREGRHFKTSQAKRHTLAQLIDRYIKDVLPKKTQNKRTQSIQKKQLEWWKDNLGSYLLSDITPALIAEYRDKLGSEEIREGVLRSPSTVVRYMAALSHAFTIAMREWLWVEDSPMRKVTKPKEPRGRVRYLSDNERKRLLKACKESTHPYLYSIVVLALATGMRFGEIMGIRWEDVNFKDSFIILHETKNGERRRIPLAGHAKEVLQELHEKHALASPLVFADFKKRIKNKPAHMTNAWNGVLKKAEIEGFRFHDLRHSAASYLAMNGASLAEIAEVLGHKTLQMVKRYAHLSEAHTSKVVASMNKRIFG